MNNIFQVKEITNTKMLNHWAKKKLVQSFSLPQTAKLYWGY